jgi:hypothetical protein
MHQQQYGKGAIQIKKLDATGNLLGVTKINETSDIIIDTEKSVFTSSTTANVEKDTDASETLVYHHHRHHRHYHYYQPQRLQPQQRLRLLHLKR